MHLFSNPDKMILNPYRFAAAGGDPFPVSADILLDDVPTHYDGSTWTDQSGSGNNATVESAPSLSGDTLSFNTAGTNWLSFSAINAKSCCWVIRLPSSPPAITFYVGDSADYGWHGTNTSQWFSSAGLFDTNATAIRFNATDYAWNGNKVTATWGIFIATHNYGSPASFYRINQLAQDRTFGRSLAGCDLKMFAASSTEWNSTQIGEIESWANSKFSLGF